MSIEITLPYPPTVNHYWLKWAAKVMAGGRAKHVVKVKVSEKGIKFRNDVILLFKIKKFKKLEGRLNVRVLVNPPDRKKRDLDNLTKALFDALANAGAYNDDSQIDEFTVKRLEIVKGGKVKVIIKEI